MLNLNVIKDIEKEVAKAMKERDFINIIKILNKNFRKINAKIVRYRKY